MPVLPVDPAWAGVVVTRGIERCLDAYRREDWVRLVEHRLATLDPLSKETRRIERFLFSAASESEPDKQGRVIIPARLLKHAQLSRDVVIAGMRDRLEIWDRETWGRELAEVEGSADDVAERLATKSD